MIPVRQRTHTPKKRPPVSARQPIQLSAPHGLHVTGASLKWNPVPYASGYQVAVNSRVVPGTFHSTSCKLSALNLPAESSTIQVQSVCDDNVMFIDSPLSAGISYTVIDTPLGAGTFHTVQPLKQWTHKRKPPSSRKKINWTPLRNMLTGKGLGIALFLISAIHLCLVIAAANQFFTPYGGFGAAGPLLSVSIIWLVVQVPLFYRIVTRKGKISLAASIVFWLLLLTQLNADMHWNIVLGLTHVVELHAMADDYFLRAVLLGIVASIAAYRSAD